MFLCNSKYNDLENILTKVGSVKSGKLFVVNDTIMQAVQKTPINNTIRYGRRTKTL